VHPLPNGDHCYTMGAGLPQPGSVRSALDCASRDVSSEDLK